MSERTGIGQLLIGSIKNGFNLAAEVLGTFTGAARAKAAEAMRNPASRVPMMLALTAIASNIVVGNLAQAVQVAAVSVAATEGATSYLQNIQNKRQS